MLYVGKGEYVVRCVFLENKRKLNKKILRYQNKNNFVVGCCTNIIYDFVGKGLHVWY